MTLPCLAGRPMVMPWANASPHTAQPPPGAWAHSAAARPG
jgi:hypothetical protein